MQEDLSHIDASAKNSLGDEDYPLSLIERRPAPQLIVSARTMVEIPDQYSRSVHSQPAMLQRIAAFIWMSAALRARRFSGEPLKRLKPRGGKQRWIYSIMGTCRLLKVDPHDYLTWVLPKLAAARTGEANGLLPHDYVGMHPPNSS